MAQCIFSDSYQFLLKVAWANILYFYSSIFLITSITSDQRQEESARKLKTPRKRSAIKKNHFSSKLNQFRTIVKWRFLQNSSSKNILHEKSIQQSVLRYVTNADNAVFILL